MDLYPLKFHEIYKPKIWGGRAIETILGKTLPEGKIGESWEVSDHFDDVSVVRNGSLDGASLREIWRAEPEAVLGGALASRGYREFPLLVKFIDAADRLSVQVHPDQAYAEKFDESGESGKNEAWYIVAAEPGARLVVGVKKGTTREQFLRLLEQGAIEECLNEVEVQAGDLVYVKAGTIHAVGPGILICEIQQTSDATYRVWDWGRLGAGGKPRPLHINHALNVIDFERGPVAKVASGSVRPDGAGGSTLLACEFFTIAKHEFANPLRVEPRGDVFRIIVLIEGSGAVTCNGRREPCRQGETLLFPSALGAVEIEPAEPTTLLETWIPVKG